MQSIFPQSSHNILISLGEHTSYITNIGTRVALLDSYLCSLRAVYAIIGYIFSINESDVIKQNVNAKRAHVVRTIYNCESSISFLVSE